MISVKSRILKGLSGVLFAMIFTPATWALVLVINGEETHVEEKEEVHIVHFQIKSKPPKKKKKTRKEKSKRVRPRRSAKRPKLAPPPDLGSSVGGVELDLPGFEQTEFQTSSQSLLGDMKDVVMTEDSVDTVPEPLRQAPLRFPKRARANNINGKVLLNCTINTEGRVKELKVAEESPAGYGFGEAAMECIRNTRFSPATFKGKPVRMRVSIPIEFNLK